MTKFVYFDVGGVVIKDFSGTNKWQEMKRDIGITSKQDKEFDEFFNNYEGKVCLGRDLETLLPLVERQFSVRFPKNYSWLKDFVDRFEKNESIWPIIRIAKDKYKIGLLTNMYPRMLDLIKKRGLMSDIKWDIEIDSSLEACKKPDEEIYRLAQEKAGVKGREILFVESSQGHIDVAEKLDWKTFLYDPSNAEESSKKLLKMIK